MDVVIDASALVALIAETSQAGQVRNRIETATMHAPHLLEAEVGHALRGLVLGGKLSERTARDGLVTAAGLIDDRHDHLPLLTAAWRLRQNVSFYDALYVALATELSCPLLSADARLASVSGLPCAVELIS